MKKLLALCTSALLGLGLSLGGATLSAVATDTCPDGGGWIKTDGVNALTKTANAPAGQLVVEACYKASTTVIYADVDPPAASYDFTSAVYNHPEGHSGRNLQNISHVSIRVVNLATASLGTTPANCDTGETLVLGAIANATWGTPSLSVGPGGYSVTATRTGSALFADGSTTKVFEGTLLGPDATQCEQIPVASAAISFTDPTCELGSSVVKGATSNATFGDVVLVGLDYTVVATATGNALFPAGAGVSGDRTTKTFTGTLEGPDTSLCEQVPVASASISFTDPTCELGSSVVKGATSNATFGDIQLVGLDYTLVATATGNALFPAGAGVSGDRTTKTFTGTLEGPDTSLCEQIPVASASISLTDPTCELGSSVVKGTTENATFGDVVLVGLDYTVVATATGNALFPAGAGVSGDRTTKTFTGTLEGLGEGLDCLITLDTDPEYSTCFSGNDERTDFDTWIRIEWNANVQYKIFKMVGGIAVSEVIAAAEFTEVVPGDYKVTATGINGYTLTPSAEKEWFYENVQDSSKECLPDLGVFDAGASATSPSCVNPSGFISFERVPDHVGFVEYFVDGVSVGTTVTKLNKAPGNYVVSAKTVDPTSSIFGYDGPWELTITAFNGECLPTLAFTGADNAEQPLQLAGGMIMLGLLGLYLRRRMVLAAAK